MAKYNLNQIQGVIPALITCFDEKENFDEKRMRGVVRNLIDNGVDGLYLTGSTGETFLMTMDERKRVVEVVVDEVKGQIPIIAHIGDIGTKKSVELAKHAYDAGVDALSSVPPFYWKFSPDEIFSYYKDIAESTPLPMIIYNIPLAGLMGTKLIKRLAKIDNVKGIKYTATTHYEITSFKQDLGNEFKVFSGCDEMSMSGLMFGADGIIGSFYNLIPELFKKIFAAVKAGDIETAYNTQSAANMIILKALNYSYFSVIKMGMRWKGVDAGVCRSPFVHYTAEQEDDIKRMFKNLKDEHGITGVDFLDAI